MDAYLEMSITLGEVPIPNGPDPVLYQHELNLQGMFLLWRLHCNNIGSN
jgi:hypothetical protein